MVEVLGVIAAVIAVVAAIVVILGGGARAVGWWKGRKASPSSEVQVYEQRSITNIHIENIYIDNREQGRE